MSANTSDNNKSSHSLPERRFVPVTEPAPLSNKIEDLGDPDRDLILADGEPIFAVAHRHGAVQVPSDDFEFEAHFVLYLTRDGERALMDIFRGDHDDLACIPRASTATTDELTTAKEDAKRFAPVVNEHPEA